MIYINLYNYGSHEVQLSLNFFRFSPVMTNVYEIKVPLQKRYCGWSCFLSINATNHGNSPRFMLSPRRTSPVEIFETPQVPKFLFCRLEASAGPFSMIANTQTTNSKFLFANIMSNGKITSEC